MDKLHEQEIVINTCNKNLIVSASAGSGKTSTMIKKILKTLIDSKCDLSKFLVLTYTNAAAGEMKSRLIKLLIEELENSQEKKFLISQIQNINVADISTFHSFYEKLVRANYYFLEINPNFTILEQEEDNKLKNKAFLNAINFLKQNKSEDYENLYNFYCKKRNEKVLKSIVFKLQDFLAAQNEPENWLNSTSTKMYNNFNLPKEVWSGHLTGNLNYFKLKFENLLKKSAELKQDKISAYLNLCLSEIESVLKLDFKNLFNALVNGYSLPRQPVFKNLNLKLIESLKAVKKDFQNFIAKIKSEQKDAYSIVEENNKLELEKVKLLIDFYKIYENELFSLKKEQNSYNFNDLEKFCYKLLGVNSLRESLKNKYEYIFIDEFQDVNAIQQKIVNMLARNNNLFIVGDPKQSIYAFRQSDVELFTQQENMFAAEENSKVLTLQKNYRTTPEILNFCNNVFSNLITKETVGIEYKEKSAFVPQANIPTNFSPVQIVLSNEENAQGKYSQQALSVVSKISNILEEQIYDKEINGFRKVNFSDIAILVRSRDALAYEIANLCEECSIPYVMEAEIDIKKSKLVFKIMSLLKVVCGYYSDIDFITVLNSFFNFSMLDLTEIKNTFDSEDFEECFKNYTKNNEIAEKIKVFNVEINHLKTDIETFGAYLALSNFFYKTDFLSFINSLKHNKFYLKDFKIFMSYIKNHYNFNIASLINMYNENESIKLEVETENQINLVKITTIHSSKGLEYPIVFLVGLDRDNFKVKNSSEVLINKNIGIALAEEQMIHFGNYTFYQNAIKFNERKMELAESLRLLYVAMTRSKNHLILFGNCGGAERITASELLFAKANYLNYILGSLPEDAITAINNQVNFMGTGYQVEFFNWQMGKELTTSANNEISFSEEEENIIKSKAEFYKNFVYDNFENVNTAQKTSVTEISQEQTYESVCDAPKAFLTHEHNPQNENALEMGNFLHEILSKTGLEFSREETLQVIGEVREKYENIELDTNKVCEIIENALNHIKSVVNVDYKTYSEKEFMLYATPKEILGYGGIENVLVQGKIDFFAVGEKIVLIDFKYSDINSAQTLINKYKTQLKIYEYAIFQATKRRVDEVYLLNIKNNKLIKIK